MGGIVFYSTPNLERISRFYQETVGCHLWLDQGGCQIFQFGNLLFGFCQNPEWDHQQALLTFFYDTRDLVDTMYEKMKETAENAPRENPRYKIYHFYATDPDGRRIEFQHFLNPIPEY